MSSDLTAPVPALEATSTPPAPAVDPAKPKTTLNGKKSGASSVPRDATAKFPWHKYPEATQHLCSIKDDLLKLGPDGKRVRGMGSLKERTRDELLEWWDDHTKEGRNKGDMHELIHNFYKNRLQKNDWYKYDGSANSDLTTTVPSTAAQTTPRGSDTKAALLDGALAPLLQAFKGRARGASTIWAKEHAEKVEKLKKTLHGQHGAHQKAIGILFGELSADEKAPWQAKADEEKAAIESDPDACFNNQSEFPNVLAAFLDCLIGHGPKQVRSALIDYQLAMRLKDGRIKLHRCTVGLEPGDEPFAEFQGGPSQEESHRWRDFVDQKLAPNPVRQDERFEYGDDGIPKLPPYDQTWSTEVAADVLQAWFELVWDYAWEHGEASLPQALDWELVTKDEAFIPPVWRNHGIRDPNEIEFFNMAVIYHRLYEAQDGPAPFHWHLPTIPVRELSMASTAVPTTPRRNTSVVFSSPVKGTPCRPRLQDSPIRAMRCDLVSIESTDVDGSKSDSENISAPLPALNVPTPLTQTAIVSTTPGTLTASAAPTAPTAPATGTTELLVNTPRSSDHACALNHVNASLPPTSGSPKDYVPAPLPVADVLTPLTGPTATTTVTSATANLQTPAQPQEEESKATTDSLSAPEVLKSTCTEFQSSFEVEVGIGGADGLPMVAKKRGATPDPVGEEERPAKRTKSAGLGESAPQPQTEPTRRSSRVRTGAAASVSYRVLGGGKDTSPSTGTKGKKGGKGKKGVTGN